MTERLLVSPQKHHEHPAARVILLAATAALTLAACSSAVSERPAPETASANPVATHSTLASTPTFSTPSALSEPNITPSPSPPSPKAATTAPSGLLGCKPYFDTATYRDHQYEVCTAYVSNSATIALQAFYKYGSHRFSYLSAPARHHFETRYYNEPRSSIERRVDSWPRITSLKGNKVEQDIRVNSVTSSLAADRGLVQTQEQWQVYSPDHTLLYHEPLHTQDITMCRGRLPGHPLHEWVVVSFQREPEFDCIGFDQANGLEP